MFCRVVHCTYIQYMQVTLHINKCTSLVYYKMYCTQSIFRAYCCTFNLLCTFYTINYAKKIVQNIMSKIRYDLKYKIEQCTTASFLKFLLPIFQEYMHRLEKYARQCSRNSLPQLLYNTLHFCSYTMEIILTIDSACWLHLANLKSICSKVQIKHTYYILLTIVL